MSDVEVYFDQELVGQLTVGDGIRPTVRFQYDSSWLSRPGAFPIDPELSLSGAPFVRAGSLFGAMRDSAPDEWGRGLLARSAKGRPLSESDYLLGVRDDARQGALRYRSGDGRWMTSASPVPVLMDLPALQKAAREAEDGSAPPLRELAAAGAGTGGARPKVVVSDNSELWIAKFARRDDEIQTESAEFVVAQLARRAGVEMSETRLERHGLEPMLLTKRFDRDGSRRFGYLSALSLLEHAVGPSRAGVYDYLDLADVLAEWSAQPTKDLHQLWRRVAFGAIVRNTDDHMRNHAFIGGPGGWRLSPAYDINTDVRSWVPFVTAINDEVADGRLAALLDTVDYFRMDIAMGRQMIAEIVAATRTVEELVDERIPAETWARVIQVVSDGTRAATAFLD